MSRTPRLRAASGRAHASRSAVAANGRQWLQHGKALRRRPRAIRSLSIGTAPHLCPRGGARHGTGRPHLAHAQHSTGTGCCTARTRRPRCPSGRASCGSRRRKCAGSRPRRRGAGRCCARGAQRGRGRSGSGQGRSPVRPSRASGPPGSAFARRSFGAPPRRSARCHAGAAGSSPRREHACVGRACLRASPLRVSCRPGAGQNPAESSNPLPRAHLDCYYGSRSRSEALAQAQAAAPHVSATRWPAGALRAAAAEAALSAREHTLGLSSEFAAWHSAFASTLRAPALLSSPPHRAAQRLPVQAPASGCGQPRHRHAHHAGQQRDHRAHRCEIWPRCAPARLALPAARRGCSRAWVLLPLGCCPNGA